MQPALPKRLPLVSRAALSQYTSTLNAEPERREREVREHAGELVARSFDGQIDYAYAATEHELLSVLEAEGIDPERVIVERIVGDDEASAF